MERDERAGSSVHKRKFQFESLEDRRLFTVTITPIASLTISEGNVAALSTTFRDSAVPAVYQSEVDWGDDTKVEPRLTPPARGVGYLTARVDYRFDTLGFFDTAEKRSAMNITAQSVLDRFGDQLSAITSSGRNIFESRITNPATGEDQLLQGISVGANELLIFVGGRDLGDETLALGAGGAYSAIGSQQFRDDVATRGQPDSASIDHAPWGGHISFDVDANWYFGVDSAELPPDAYDFRSVATHEMLHLMGFSDSIEAFSRHVSAGRFGGPNAVKAYDINGQPPISQGGSHWASNVRDDGQIPVMMETMDQGRRSTITSLDLAAMQDIGWQPLATTEGTIESEHLFADDGIYFGLVNIATSSETASAPFRVIVENAMPQLTGIENQQTVVGQAVRFEATILDSGIHDSHQVTVDWGDGTEDELVVDSSNRVAATHIYNRPGDFVAEFTTTDDDGASRRQRATVEVVSISNSMWQNRSMPLDVNSDGDISPVDALWIINELNRPTVSDDTGKLPDASPNKDGDNSSPAFFDVNADGFVSPHDALFIINSLNRGAVTRSVSRSDEWAAAAAIDYLLSMDDEWLLGNHDDRPRQT